MGVPDEVVKKKPSARLWKGQTDEDEMGISYIELDKILKGIEMGMTAKEISEKEKIDLSKIERVIEAVEISRHKRELAPIAPVRALLEL